MASLSSNLIGCYNVKHCLETMCVAILRAGCRKEGVAQRALYDEVKRKGVL